MMVLLICATLDQVLQPKLVLRNLEHFIPIAMGIVSI